MKLEFLRGYNRKTTVEIFVANDVCLLGVLFYKTVLHHVSTQRKLKRIENATTSEVFLTKFEFR